MNFIELKNKLQQPYDQSNWVEWLQDIFGLQVSIDTNPDTLIIEKGNAKSVHRFASLQMSDDRHIAILDIVTSSSVQIARNRVALRDIVFKLIDQDKYHGLLVFYHSEDIRQSDYRLSFISSQSTFDSEGNFINQSTHPKRYSFLLGPNESCYTAAQRLRELKNKVPPFKAFELQKGISLQDLQDTFSVEKLNKDFFNKYEYHYRNFCEHISKHEYYSDLLIDHQQEDQDKKEKPIRDWVKKMLGRIVFLHFLQKKGWMACPSNTDEWKYGDHNFLYNLFESCPDQNKFYSKVLIPLFFKTLNTKRSDDLIPNVFSYYRDIQISKHENVNNLKIPYLNGGLFENVDQQCNIIDFPGDYFANLLEFFQQYNFTIDENSPDEQEVGIDPEMLGHIFENLLEENKDKGAFYTPKKIVHYMCQESLIEYLRTYLPECKEDDAPETIALKNFIRNDDIGNRTDNKNYLVVNAKKIEELLDRVKICDPAIGSGAFPMGMLQEIFKAKMTLDLTQDKVAVKKGIIRNSIYGVDLESGAVDIARLRFWLSLIVDADEPEPLPNLDYKIMQGDSLVENYGGIELSNILEKESAFQKERTELFPDNSNVFSASEKDVISKHLEHYFNPEKKPNGITKSKNEIKKEINGLIEEVINQRIIFEKERLKKRIQTFEDDIGHLDSKSKNINKKSKLYKTYQNNIKILSSLDKIESDLIDLQLTNSRPYFLWDLFFSEIFSNGGFDIVIGNPPYVQLRQLSKDTQDRYLDSKYFEDAKGGRLNLFQFFIPLGFRLAKNKGIICLITQNSLLGEDTALRNRKLIFTDGRPIKFDSFPERDNKNKRVFENVKMSVAISIFQKIRCTDSKIVINVWSDKNMSTKSYLSISQSELLKIFPSNFIIPLASEQTINILKHITNNVNSSYLKASAGEIDMTKFKSKFSENGRRVFTGAQILRYHTTKNPSQGKVLYLNEIDLPNTPKMTYSKFDRIVMQRITGVDSNRRLVMTILPKNMLCANSTNFILPNDNFDLHYLLALLNSKCINFFFKLTSTNTNVTTSEIQRLPIVHSNDWIKISRLSQYLSFLYSDKYPRVNKYANNIDLASSFEDVLDLAVYELYFDNHVRKNELNVLEYIDTKNLFRSIIDVDLKNQVNIIGECYSWLQREKNPIRNRLMLADVRSKDIIGRINSATH